MGKRGDEEPPEEGTVGYTPPRAGSPSRPLDPLLGTKVDDRYELKLVLGKGGMGTVYLADDTKLGRRVALKLMGGSLATDPEFRSRFEREAVLQANLPHPQIIQIMDTGETTGGPYMVLEYSNGRSLSRLLRELGPMPVDRALNIALQILEVLDFAHGQNVIHRDLKPANILIEDRPGKEVVRLLDFGIAKLLSSEGGEEFEHTLTKQGSAYGTLGYMAPEQARGDMDKVDHRVDIYAVGIMLLEMLTGEVPAPRESRGNAVRYAMWVAENPIKPLAETHPEFAAAAAVDRFLGTAVRRDPDSRYSSALAFSNAIRESRPLVTSAMIPAPVSPAVPATEMLESQPAVSSAPSTAGWLAAGLLAIATAVACFLYFRVEEEAADARADLERVNASLTSMGIADGDLDGRFRDLELKFAESDSAQFAQELAQRNADVVRSEQANKQLEIDLTGSRKELEDATTEVTDLAGQIADRDAEIARLKQANTQLDTEVKTQRGDRGEFIKKLEKATADTAKLKIDLGKSETAKEEAGARSKKLEAESVTREDELQERNAEVKALKNAEAKLKRDLEALSKGRDDLIKELGEATADAARLKIEIQRLMDNPRGADAAALAAARDREARLTKSFKEAEATIEELTNKLREYEEQPDATLTIENVSIPGMRRLIVRLMCDIPGADEPTEVLYGDEGADVVFPTAPITYRLPKGTRRVTVVYYKWDNENKKFPKTRSESSPTAIAGKTTTIKIK